MWRGLMTVALLVGSNTFMTFAWYYHVQRRPVWPLLTAIGLSWLIALPEYILQVPANRYGHVDNGGVFTLGQLKILQEGITLGVFVCFAVFVAKERIRTNEIVGFGLVMVGVVVAMIGKK